MSWQSTTGGANITERLTATHRELRAGYDRLFGLVERFRPREARLASAELKTRLAMHQRLEEVVVYPLFDGAPSIRRATATMRHEHRLLLEAAEAIDEALAQGDDEALAQWRGRLAAVMPEHHLKEELLLFPRVDALLSDAERYHVLERLGEPA